MLSIISLVSIVILFIDINTTNAKPNIIFMMADDIGYNDVQFTSLDLSQPSSYTKTPHINKLATEQGVILDNYYVHRMCSASRAALLTGRYSWRYGISTKVLTAKDEIALTRQVSLISNEFQAAGYKTHAIGYDLCKFTVHIYVFTQYGWSANGILASKHGNTRLHTEGLTHFTDIGTHSPIIIYRPTI